MAARKYRARRAWTDEQRRAIVAEAIQARRDQTGSLKTVGEKYDVGSSVLSRWVRIYGSAAEAPTGDVQALAAQLGEALARVKALKKALREALGD